MTKIAFVGLGTMGSHMCRRLVEAGHDVGAWNRTEAATDPLVSAGARRIASEEILEAPMVFSMLSNDAATEAVFSEAALRNALPNTLHVAMESISLAGADRAIERHRAAGVEYLAAPVIGRPAVAEAGQLNIIAAGPRDSFELASPLFEALGRRVWYFGDKPRLAYLVKICVNYNLIHTIQALSETIALVERGGVDPKNFVELLTNSLYPGPAYTGYGAAIADRHYTPPGFTVELGLKDLTLAEDAARELEVSLPTAPVLREMFELTLARPDADELDWAAIAEVVRESGA